MNCILCVRGLRKTLFCQELLYVNSTKRSTIRQQNHATLDARHYSWKSQQSVRLTHNQNRFIFSNIMAEGSDSLRIGDLDVYPWAVSGVESCIVVKGAQDGLRVAFDMGCATREGVNCQHVFIRLVKLIHCLHSYPWYNNCIPTLKEQIDYRQQLIIAAVLKVVKYYIYIIIDNRD